jgi:hypothetical protein
LVAEDPRHPLRLEIDFQQKAPKRNCLQFLPNGCLVVSMPELSIEPSERVARIVTVKTTHDGEDGRRLPYESLRVTALGGF